MSGQSDLKKACAALLNGETILFYEVVATAPARLWGDSEPCA
jgi:hypothetical protein